MRKTLIALIITGLVTLGVTPNASAQRRGGVAHGGNGGFSGGHGGGVYIGTPIGSVGVGPHGGVYVNAGYGGLYRGGFGSPYYGYGNGYSYPSYYDYGYPSYYSGYSYPDYYSAPYYPYAGNYNTTMPTQSYYGGPQGNQQPIMLTVLVPSPDTQLWVGDQPMQTMGMERIFQSRPLEPGTYSYTLKARWMENGQPVDREKTVNVQPGQRTMVDFRSGK